jgi:hypothetical protein
MKRLEHALQIAVAHMLQLVLDPERTWWSAIDHGVGKLGVVEATQRKKRGVKPGLPDIMLLVYGSWPCLIGIELKAGKGMATEAQRSVAMAWRNMGHRYEIARSLEEVQDILARHRVPTLRRMTFFSGGGHECHKRPAKTWHRSEGRGRKSKGHLSLVLPRPAKT